MNRTTSYLLLASIFIGGGVFASNQGVAPPSAGKAIKDTEYEDWLQKNPEPPDKWSLAWNVWHRYMLQFFAQRIEPDNTESVVWRNWVAAQSRPDQTPQSAERLRTWLIGQAQPDRKLPDWVEWWIAALTNSIDDIGKEWLQGCAAVINSDAKKCIGSVTFPLPKELSDIYVRALERGIEYGLIKQNLYEATFNMNDINETLNELVQGAYEMLNIVIRQINNVNDSALKREDMRVGRIFYSSTDSDFASSLTKSVNSFTAPNRVRVIRFGILTADWYAAGNKVKSLVLPANQDNYEFAACLDIYAESNTVKASITINPLKIGEYLKTGKSYFGSARESVQSFSGGFTETYTRLKETCTQLWKGWSNSSPSLPTKR